MYRSIQTHLLSQDSFIRREITALTNAKHLYRITAAAAVYRTLLRIVINCFSVFTFLQGVSFKATNNFSLPPPPSVHSPRQPEQTLQNIYHFCLVHLKTHSNFIPARNRRFSNSNYASKQPSPRTGNSG